MNHQIDYKLLDENKLAETFGRDCNGVLTVPTASHNNCGNRCIIHIRIKDGKILELTTDDGEETPDNLQIRSCLKGHSYLETFLHKDRLLYPMKRVGKRGEGKFTRISWEEAIHTISHEMTRIRDAYGPASRYCNYATGYEMCCASPSAMIRRLLALDGGYLEYYNNYSCSPSALSARLTYGTEYTGNSRKDYINSKYIILWGFNPAETFCGGNTMYYLLQAKKAGTKIVVIDPRFSDTAAALADEWISPLPTTDSALSDAMAYVIYTKGLHNQYFLDTFCMGFDGKTLPSGIPDTESYLSYILGKKDGIKKSPDWASSITGLEPHVIETIAIEYATAKPAAILEGYGPGRHAYGEQFSRGLITLACMTGNVGISGGSAAGIGQVFYGVNYLTESPGRPANPYPGKIPCFCWTDMIENACSFTPEMGLQGVEKLNSNIKLIFNLAGNCLINQHGDCNLTAKLLEDTSKVEFIVCSDIFMTPSARYADILLPGTTMLETENITASPARFDHFFKINPVMEPPGECRFDYDWIRDVARQLGMYETFTEHKSLHQWLCDAVNHLQKVLPDFPDMDILTTAGVYKRNSTDIHVAFAHQINNFPNHPFPTPSGKIEIFVSSLYEKGNPDINPIPGYMPAWEGPQDPLRKTYPLQCIGFHTKARTHSVHDNNPKLQKLVPQEVWIHPEDARKRNIQNHEKVLVYNDRGKIRIMAKITERIVPGVVAIPQGAWFTPDESGIDTRGCINAITSLRTTPVAKANAQHTNLVDIRKANPDFESSMEKSFAIERDLQSSCSGCLTCVAACPYGSMKVEEIPVLYKRTPTDLHTISEKKPVFYHPIPCGRCEKPACKASCPLRILS